MCRGMRTRWSLTSLVMMFTLMFAANATAAVRIGPLVRSGRPGVRPLSALNRVNRSTVTSANWSGYAATGTTFSDVKASWVQPAVSCSSYLQRYSSFWVGIDGYNSKSVEQIGADSDCTGRNRPSYYAWYEMYPAGSVQTSLSVQPGDALSAEVSVKGSAYTLTIVDSRSGAYTTTQTASGNANSSAEWITEAPEICYSFFCSNAQLANFGTTNFTGASATGSSATNGPIGAFTNNEIVMETSYGTVRAQPSPLTAGGSAFSDTWKSS
jgi:hypothetical protein